MSNKLYTTNTASLKATTADIRKVDAKKINLKGKDILEYIDENKTTVIDERGDFVTDQDLWGTSVTTDENGVVHVSHKFLSGSPKVLSSVKSIKDNKAYISTDASGEPLCNIQTNMIKDGTRMFSSSPIVSFSSDLSSLIDGTRMFENRSALTSFSGDLSSLVKGESMFSSSSIDWFGSNLYSLTNGAYMFSNCSALEGFTGNVYNLVNGLRMFNNCTSLDWFRADLNSLTNGAYMFYNCTALTEFDRNLSSLVDGTLMFYNCTSLSGFITNLNSLVYGDSMFLGCSTLTVFNGNLNNLVSGLNMFHSTSLIRFDEDLSNLVNGSYMFYTTPLILFINTSLSNLVNGSYMFCNTSLSSFKSSTLNSLVDGESMFLDCSALTSFSGDLSNLVNGKNMFSSSSITSFSGDLSSLVYGLNMFRNTAITSFSGDLSSLVDGNAMFTETYKRDFSRSYYVMSAGKKQLLYHYCDTDGLTSFSCDLGSLQCGYEMFGDGKTVNGETETTKNITPLDEQSVMIIADTINDLNGLSYNDWDKSINSAYRGIIHIGYDSTVCNAATIEEYCTEIMNKGWKVYLNGTVQTTDDGIEGIATTDENGNTTVAPVPYYCKPVEVELKEAKWTDGEKYYIILGAQKVFGDDLSTYGMFTSIEDAIMNMGFTPYKYVEEETETVEEN